MLWITCSFFYNFIYFCYMFDYILKQKYLIKPIFFCFLILNYYDWNKWLRIEYRQNNNNSFSVTIYLHTILSFNCYPSKYVTFRCLELFESISTFHFFFIFCFVKIFIFYMLKIKNLTFCHFISCFFIPSSFSIHFICFFSPFYFMLYFYLFFSP